MACAGWFWESVKQVIFSCVILELVCYRFLFGSSA
jgi:hypothetical protein